MNRTTIRKTVLSSAAAAGLVFSVGACSSSTTDDNAAFCDAAANLATQVDSLKSMVTGGTATVDQIQDQRDQVKQAGQDTADAAKDLEDSVKSDVSDADSEFESSVKDIPTDQSLKEAAPAYLSAVAAYNTSLNSVKSQVGCS